MTTTNTKTGPDLDDLAERLEHARSFESRLWAKAPAVGRARARLGRLTTAVSGVKVALAATVAPVPTIIDAALDMALDGESIDADRLRSDVLASLAAGQVAEAVASAVAGRMRDLPDEVRRAEVAAEDDALAVLDEAVRELVAVGRDLLPLCELNGTLRDAGRAGQARALLEVAVSAHDALRARQQGLTTSLMFSAASLVRQFGIVRDVSSLAPWAQRLGGVDWSDAPDLEALVIAGGEPLFRLVCRDDLEPWVPIEPQLVEAERAMRERVDKVRWEQLNPSVEKVVTEDEPRFTLTGTGAGKLDPRSSTSPSGGRR